MEEGHREGAFPEEGRGCWPGLGEREGVRRGELMGPRLGKEGLVEVCGDHQPRHVGK